MRLTGLLSAALNIGSGLSSSPFDIPPGRLHPRQATGVAWKPCFRENTECVGLAVPLDYANPSAGSARLAVIRYKATATPRLGSLFLNPGGPGGSGVQLVELSGRTFSNLTGGHYDIVGQWCRLPPLFVRLSRIISFFRMGSSRHEQQSSFDRLLRFSYS
ncbi:hypothetical protein FRC03_011091 [Tulasnella sp. 419]|nr:hypothetical protein FRC03_011091 [Tulasnella sp. 419]